jgi:uncharacterized membrane protein
LEIGKPEEMDENTNHLERRYASGEIDREEFERMRELLSG